MKDEELCTTPLDMTEETLSSLVHLADNGVEGAEAELDRRMKSLPNR